MLSIGVAFKAFFKALFDKKVSDRIENAMGLPAPQEEAATTPTKTAESQPKKIATPKPSRSDALILVEMLQREGRLLDFLMEDIEPYGDADVGVAVRDVHRGCRDLLTRVFDLQPLVEEEEGAQVQVPADYSAGKYRLVGQVSGDPPFTGELLHHGWTASKLALPEWKGSSENSKIVCPIEVEVKSSS